jgi:NDP-4-keto-2,6-dideoxyhexose 3-C-methyltransferase
MAELSREVIRPIAGCRVCGNHELLPVLDLGRQTLTGRFQKPGDPDLPTGPLELVLCHGVPGGEICGLLQLRHSCDPGEMFGETYGYRSSMNATMIEHLRRKTKRLLAVTGAGRGDRVLDIGSNDGTLLRCYEGTPVERFGIDPSSGRFAAEYPSDATLIVDFFAADKLRAHSGNGFKVITSLAMFYDVETPLQFMAEIRSMLASDGVWEFEQSYMPDMLDRLFYDTICHEHLTYYGMRQIVWMAERSGLKILDVELNAINGGSFSILAARREAPYAPNTTKIDALLTREFALNLGDPAPYRTFARQTAEHREQMQSLFYGFQRRGQTILGYGASTKGNVMLQYWGLTAADMPAIAEKHPGKLGLLTPGTKIPIISEKEARNRRPDAFLVLPWHFKSEIVTRESEFLNEGGSLLFPLPELHSFHHTSARRPTSELAVTK